MNCSYLSAFRTVSLLIFVLIFNPSANAQLVEVGAPVSWNNKVAPTQQQFEVLLPPVNIDQLHAEDVINDSDKSGPWRFGFNHQVFLSMDNSGEWTTLKNGDRIWRLVLNSPEARTINVIFDDFFIPKGAFMHMYSADRIHIVGAYTHLLNNEDRILGTELVEGSEIVIEYFEPKSVTNQGSLKIGTVTHGYRSPSVIGEQILRGLNDSGACNIDVLCPLGNGWEDQIRSVALIVVGGNGICTGALVNNTLQDGKPYFLTANHCLGNPANWVFRFNWHSNNPSCATTAPSGNGPFVQTAFNGTRRASNQQSDFALIELNQPLPSDWNLYYAGWDRSDLEPNFTVGIHHPNGDIKKICRDDDPAYKTTTSGAQVWRVDQWEHGVTEGGSSGSPLFDPNKRIIGQLLGGLAACSFSNPTQNNGQYDVYGRLAVSWNGNNPSSRLRDWLDPQNSGVVILDGYDPLIGNFDYDLALLSVGADGNYFCETEITLTPQIRNSGSQSVQTFNIQVLTPLNTLLDYQWTGNLSSGEIINVQLPPVPLASEVNDLTMIISNPNGFPDEDPSNNSDFVQLYAVTNGGKVFFNLTTDCWGSEITWNIKDLTGSIAWQGGPYSDVAGGETFQYELCLEEGCYTFEINDSYGDGLYGSQYNTCSVNGNYSMTDEMGNLLFQMTAPNGDFGESAIHPFCVEATQSLFPDFGFNVSPLCESALVSFTDLSEGNVNQWNWSFPGGSPASSNEQNPEVFYNNPGTYFVTLQIIDSNGNSDEIIKSIVLEERDIPFISIMQLEEFGCGDLCNGQLQVSIAGGQAPFDILWNNGAQTPLLIDVCYRPNYSVTVTDAFGCESSLSVDFEQEDIPEFEVLTSVNCDSGEVCAQLESSEDLSVYNIQWSNGDNSMLSSCNLSNGANTVIVSNDNGCSKTKFFSKPAFEFIEIIVDQISNACSGACDASISLSVLPVGYPVFFEWSSSDATFATLTEACPGEHTVTVTDAHGCGWVQSFDIIDTEPISYDLTSDLLHCNKTTGCAELNISGGTEPYTVVWSSGVINGLQACELLAGLHGLTITDTNGCQVEESFMLQIEANPILTAVTVGEACENDCNGSISVDAIGSAPFQYQWSNSNMGTSIQENLCPGLYSITVIDKNGCEGVVETIVTEGPVPPIIHFTPSALDLNINSDPTVLFNNKTFGASAYLWSFGDGNFSEEESPKHTYLQIGVFNVVLTAFNGTCARQDSISINVSEFTRTQSYQLDRLIFVFPNPASTFVTVKILPGMEYNGPFRLEVMDMNGRLMMSNISINPDELSTELDIKGLLPGAYMIRIASDKSSIMKRLIIH